MTAEAPFYEPLVGVRVLDLTGHYAGAHVTRILADLGAEVIKVEAAQHIDLVPRGLLPTDNRPTDLWWRRSGYYAERNLNKLGITLDLNSAGGKDVFFDLLAISDVLTENFTPRVMRHFGFEHERLRERKPDLIQLSLSGYGRDGPLGDAPANAHAMLAAAGLAKAMAYPSDRPLIPTLSLADMFAGISCVPPILAALQRRRETGEGELIDVAGREAPMAMGGGFVLQAQRPPAEAGPPAYRTVVLACRGEESWLVASYRDAAEWGALCEVLAVGEATPRPLDGDELPAIVRDRARGVDAEVAARELQARGVAAAPCLDGRQLLLDPHLRERGAFAVCHHDDPELGARPYGRAFPVRVRGRRPRPLEDAPLALGRDNRRVLGGLLGYPEERIQQLYDDGVAGEEPSSRFGRAWATPLDVEAMIADGGALPAPEYREALSAAYGTPIGPVVDGD